VIWAVAIALALAVAAALGAPLLRAPRAGAARRDYDLAVYREQLRELDRDVASGVIPATEAKAARAEIARRMLAADAAREGDAAPPGMLAGVALSAALVAPLAALALYAALGRPAMPARPYAERAPERAAQQADAKQMDEMVAGLRAKLAQAPDDDAGWALLARSLGVMERWNEALEAWRKALALAGAGAGPAERSAYGEAAVMAANGVVTPEAREAFARVREAMPDDPRAAFYLGLARAQGGDPHGALQEWTDLIARSPADAPWIPAVRERIAETSRSAGIDPATLRPSADAARAGAVAALPAAPPPRPAPGAPRGPTADQVEAAQGMNPEQRQQMIRGMVEQLAARLESEPDDLEGWRRLARARAVLGERERAVEAARRAAMLAPGDVAVLGEYADLVAPASAANPLPPEFVAVMRQILALAPDHGDALYVVGLADAAAGDRAAARAHWTRLLAMLPSGSPEAGEIKRRIDSLGAN
jgi:cytochrome c-type biogenesis protein CcmH